MLNCMLVLCLRSQSEELLPRRSSVVGFFAVVQPRINSLPAYRVILEPVEAL